MTTRWYKIQAMTIALSSSSPGVRPLVRLCAEPSGVYPNREVIVPWRVPSGWAQTIKSMAESPTAIPFTLATQECRIPFGYRETRKLTEPPLCPFIFRSPAHDRASFRRSVSPLPAIVLCSTICRHFVASVLRPAGLSAPGRLFVFDGMNSSSTCDGNFG